MQLEFLGIDHRDLMKEALNSQHKEVRIGAIRGFRNIGDESSIKILEDLLNEGDQERNVIIAAAEALGDMGAKSAIPLLRKIADETDDNILKSMFYGQSRE